MPGEILACFSCTGKSHFVHEYYKKFDCVDHDMYDFAFASSKKIRDDWLRYYLERMRFFRKKYSLVLVNATPEILEKLPSTCPIVFPERGLVIEYRGRAQKRGSSQFFLQLQKEWDAWISACEGHKSKYKYRLGAGEYLSDWMLKREHGGESGWDGFLLKKYNDDWDYWDE